ncbi:unnamed protein product [Gordionus sp. m RMFG-2023]
MTKMVMSTFLKYESVIYPDRVLTKVTVVLSHNNNNNVVLLIVLCLRKIGAFRKNTTNLNYNMFEFGINDNEDTSKSYDNLYWIIGICGTIILIMIIIIIIVIAFKLKKKSGFDECKRNRSFLTYFFSCSVLINLFIKSGSDQKCSGKDANQSTSLRYHSYRHENGHEELLQMVNKVGTNKSVEQNLMAIIVDEDTTIVENGNISIFDPLICKTDVVYELY